MPNASATCAAYRSGRHEAPRSSTLPRVARASSHGPRGPTHACATLHGRWRLRSRRLERVMGRRLGICTSLAASLGGDERSQFLGRNHFRQLGNRRWLRPRSMTSWSSSTRCHWPVSLARADRRSADRRRTRRIHSWVDGCLRDAVRDRARGCRFPGRRFGFRLLFRGSR